jgi:hypothetical protein
MDCYKCEDATERAKQITNATSRQDRTSEVVPLERSDNDIPR